MINRIIPIKRNAEISTDVSHHPLPFVRLLQIHHDMGLPPEE
jgi:hypothetical protein